MKGVIIYCGMRFFLHSALLIALVVSSARAQDVGTTGSFDLERYVKALEKYVGADMPFLHTHEMMKTLPQTVRLASLDPTLAKAQNVRLQTLGIFRDIEALDVAGKKGFQEKQDLQKKANAEASRASSSNNSNNGRNFKPSKQMTLMTDQNEVDMRLRELDKKTQESIKVRLATISKLAGTPEGQQFAMPESSAFLAVISPPAMRGGRMSGPLTVVPDFKRFEVVNTVADGFYGYETKLAVNTEQNGDQPPGSDKKDAEGNYVHIGDPSKNVFVRGYTKPASLGDIVRIKVSRGESKTINGVPVREYVVVPE